MTHEFGLLRPDILRQVRLLAGFGTPAIATSAATTKRGHKRLSRPNTINSTRRIDAMYIDKLDGKIGGDFFDNMAGQWREEQRPLPPRHRAPSGG